MNEKEVIDRLVAQLIPPNDYQHRHSFENEHLLDKLRGRKRRLVEEALIRLLETSFDYLVIETLVHLKCTLAAPVMFNTLSKEIEPMKRLILATAIFKLSRDDQMLPLAVEAFEQLDNSGKMHGFDFLKKFENERSDNIIRQYVDHPDYLLSYSAKQALQPH